MKSSNYWDKRAMKRLTASEKQSEAYIAQVKKMYNRASRNVKRQISRIYINYSNETGLDIQTLKTLLTASETDKVWKKLKQKGLDQYVKQNYKTRITRLEQLKAQIYQKTKELYPLEDKVTRENYEKVIKDTYNRTMYDTAIGTGYDIQFNSLDNRTIRQVLSNRWSGKNYSERIWNNTDILGNQLGEILGAGITSGQGLTKTIRQVTDVLNAGRYNAERLIRTETNYFHNQADALAYEELGIDKYVCVATLDGRTSKFCQGLDNKSFNYKDIKVGKNFPPFHPNCRCKTRGYVEEYEHLLKRRAKDPETGEESIIDNMSYNEWQGNHNIGKTLKNSKKSSIIEIDSKEEIKSEFNINDIISYNEKSFKKLDEKLIENNTNQLEKLFKEYPKVAKFASNVKLEFGAKTTKASAIAVTSHTYDMRKLGIYLSNKYYKNYESHIKVISESIKEKLFMPCSKKNISTYALNHEFGHLIENYLINEYSLKNLSEYTEVMKRAMSASSEKQLHIICRGYERKICDNIAEEIIKIASKNKDFVLKDNLSIYGMQSSQEFFAECFANMVSGKRNELGKAMKIYLKGVM